MYENVQQSPVVILLKKAWPFIYRVINTVFYMSVQFIRNGFREIIAQIKGTF
jgi:hypothetical protein